MFKKIMCMLLCLLMLGAVVACDDTPPTVPTINDDEASSTPKADENEGEDDDDNSQTTTTPTVAQKEEVWLNVMTYNIVRCQDQTTNPKQTDPMNIVNVIKDEKIDICGLNEVDRNASRSGGYDQPKWIAEKLKAETGDEYYWAFAAGLDGYHTPFSTKYELTEGKAKYGNAIISKYPIQSVREVEIAMKENQLEDGYERRVLLIADIDIKGKILTVLVSHFDLKADAREYAVDLILDELAGIKNPVLLMGDFNCQYESSPIQRLSQKLKSTSIGTTPYTFPSDNPSSKIDYIFVEKTQRTKNHKVLNYKWSDHCPVMVQMYWGMF